MEEVISNISNTVIMICLICGEVDYKGRKTKKMASKLLRNHTSVVWVIYCGAWDIFGAEKRIARKKGARGNIFFGSTSET